MYDVNILVNGSRCKQYNHNGKIFIEAKEGSEYVIEIKNSTWKRILAVCSVDGLDILNGKPATENGPGYVINALNSCKFDGFRVSDDKVAKFIFSKKADSYAADKGDGAERNVGVIGIRLFEEKVKPAPIIIREEHHHHHDHYPKTPWKNPMWDWDSTGTPHTLPPSIWCDVTYGTSMNDNWAGAPTDYSCENIPKKSSHSKVSEKLTSNVLRAMNCSADIKPQGFDMGTKWGEAKESRVIEVEFERGILALTTNIYYTSRQSLIEMGVPIGNEKQVSFPEPFVDSKYAKPPKGWNA